MMCLDEESSALFVNQISRGHSAKGWKSLVKKKGPLIEMKENARTVSSKSHGIKLKASPWIDIL